jgi:hypothetical protein
MSLQTSCPDSARLQALLDGVLLEGEQAELNTHLEACPGCQQQLEALSAADEASRVARRLGQQPAQSGPALRQAIDRLKNDPDGPETRAEPGGGEEIALDFLAPPAKPGQLGRLGHYEVLEVVGRGGMGVVLRAFDEKLHRVVAIKVMAPELAASASARQRFIREARAAAAVTHEHVVGIYAVEEDHRPPYIVMQYVGGTSLQERLDGSGPLELKEILRIGHQAACGLAAAHAQGLVHRDVKPANILLENGVERVKLTDFGLARAADDATLTQSGVVAGTPQYMAPEQARGEAVDSRADLFSLGSVLYAMCTGRPPFRASTSLGVLKRVSEDTPRPIREINPDIPAWLVEIIGRLHAKEPRERFQSAKEVADLLGRHLAHLQQPALVPMPSPASPSPAAPRGRRWALAATLLVLLVGGLGLTEATGITQVVPSVIRVFHLDGTLVVEVDDPGVSVTIDGEELVITGAGPKEVRLKPGQYKLHATKDGNPVPISQELITITHGGKQVVKVSRVQPERAATAPDAFRKEFEQVVQAGRGKLSKEERQRLIDANDSLMTQLNDPPTRKLIELFANLPDAVHKELLEKGYLKWKFTDLDAERQKVYRDAVQFSLDPIKKQGGEPTATMSLEALEKSDVGFAVVDIPESGQKVVSWYILFPEQAPIWVTMVGVQAAGAPPYFATHQKQLPLLRKKPYSKPPAEQTGQADRPFVLLAREGRPEQTFDSLPAAVAVAASGDTIELRGDGPFFIDPAGVRITTALTIRASAGCRPRLQMAPADPGLNSSNLIETNAPLTLEGLDLGLGDARAKPSEWALVSVEGQPLRMSNCVLRAAGFRFLVWLRSVPEADIQNCLFLGGTGGGTHYRRIAISQGETSQQVAITNCIFGGSTGPSVWVTPEQARPTGSLRLRLSSNTFDIVPLFWSYSRFPARIDVEATANVVQADQVLRVEGAPDPLTLDDLRKAIRWSGRQNVYPIHRALVAPAPPGYVRDGGIAAWNRLWEQPEEGSLVGSVLFEGWFKSGRDGGRASTSAMQEQATGVCGPAVPARARARTAATSAPTWTWSAPAPPTSAGSRRRNTRNG